MRTSVLYSVLAVALVVGTACKGPDSVATDLNHFAATVRGANVSGAADTSVSGTASITINSDNTFTWSYTTTATVDSVAMYTATAAAAITTATTPSVLLCGTGAGACTGSGTTGVIATAATVQTSARGYGQQLVFFGPGTRPNNGIMRGTVYPIGN